MDCRVSALMSEGVSRLSACDLPRLESYLLLSHATGLSKERLLAMRDEEIPEVQATQFLSLVERRRAGEPSAYILGEKEFYGRSLQVTPDVLIPRPDTEILVEEAINLIEKENLTTVWDLCTGSSAIILSIAAEILAKAEERPSNSDEATRHQFFASDISEAALAIAKSNLARYRLPVQLFQGNLLEAMPQGLTVDLIATNPPYLTNAESDEKIAEGWREPDLALRGGEDGLDLIRIIAKQAIDKLNNGGYLLIEASGNQMDTMQTILEAAGFVGCYRIKDLASIERVLVGQKQNGSNHSRN